MLAGRTLLKRYKQKEKFVIATTLLENPETHDKLMSKSLGTGVGLNESPKAMFAGIMQLPDAGILQIFIDCTRMELTDIEDLRKRMENGENPRDIKFILAREIVSMYHGAEAAKIAHENWTLQVSSKQLATDIPELSFDNGSDLLVRLVDIGIVDSKSKARQLIEGGGIRVGDQKLDLNNFRSALVNGAILHIGKKHSFIIKR